MARRRPPQQATPSRNRVRQRARQLLYQTLEQRQLLAGHDGPRLIGVSPNSGELLAPQGTSVLDVSPSEVIVRFDGGQQLDPATLAGIQLVRSGNDGQIDADHAQDVVIQPGFVGFGDSQREVVMRFAEPLPDDIYELEIFGFDDVNRGIVGLRNTDGSLFRPKDPAANREVIPFQVELGAQIRAVVPQPIARDAAGKLRQERNQVAIYFNDDDLVRQLQLPAGQQSISTSDVTSGFLPTVIDPQFYQLILTRQTVSGNDDVVVLPTEIEYDPSLDRAILTFGEDQNGDPITDLAHVARTAGVPAGDATFRLRVGDDTAVSNVDMPIRPRTENLLGGDTGSSFALADTATLGTLSGVATLVQEQIQATDRYALNYPGAFDEPGAREVLEQNHLSVPFGDRDDGVDARAISTLYYNFNKSTPYGVSDNGQQLFNAITPAQEQRAREIFEQLGDEWGIDFVETSSHTVDGVAGASLSVVVGDLVVFGTSGSTNQSGPGGVFGGVPQTPDAGLGGAHTFGRRIVLLDRGESWFNERGLPEATDISRLSFYVHAMTLIGNALGVGVATDQPPGTSMSGLIRNVTLGGEIDLLTANPVEPALPGDSDNVHGRYLYRPESRDIDVYEFSVGAGEVGIFSAEVFAERLHESASLLDSRLALYDAQGTLLAANDDYYGEDAFLQLELGEGSYYLAVSASGNDQYNLNVNNSGAGGTSEGRYDVLVNFVAKANAEIVDTSGTAIDGDGDGVAGGAFNYWFRATSDLGHTPVDSSRGPTTLLVDKSHTPTVGASIPIGTEANPYNNITRALAAARKGDTVRIVGNGGLDGNLSTLEDSFAYEIGRGGDQDAPLSDGLQLDVPSGVHVVIDAGAVFKMRNSRIGVGSSTTVVDRSGGSLQVLGTPFLSNGTGAPVVDADGLPLAGSVIFTSYNDQSLGVDTNPLNTTPIRGEWGGIEFRNDVDRSQGRLDLEQQGIFLNYVAHGDFRYGGGQVDLDSQTMVINPIHMTASRPSILENTITLSADAAISADPESFEETNFNSPRYQQNDPFVSNYTRVGPDLRGNYLADNSTNGLFVRLDTLPGQPTQQLTVAARFDDRDIVHFIGDTLIVQGTPGGPRLESEGPAAASVALAASTPATGSSTLNTSPGNVSFTYRITWVDAYGGESIPSGTTASVTVAPGQQVNLSNLPAAPADFVSRRIYRSQPGGQGPFVLVDNLDRSSLSFTDRGGSTGATLAGPQAVAEPAPMGSTLPNTRLEYRFTLVDNQGNEFLVNEPPLAVDVAANQQVRLSHLPGNDVSAIPGFNPDRIVARRIYRSAAGANDFRRVGQTDLRSQQFVDDGSATTFVQLANNLPLVDRSRLRSRPDARLAIDPGVVVKLEGTRIETGYGAQLIAEGVDGQPVVFTARADDRYGAGGTFDTNNDQDDTTPQPGDWGGIYISPVGSVSLDYTLITHGGGEVATGGSFAGFNALEIVQATGRVTNSTFERNASGLGGGQGDQQRDGRGFNEPAAIFVRAAQPVIVNNIIRDNVDPVDRTAAISINVNALNSELLSDPGRQTGSADRFADIRGNQGPLIRQNLIGGNTINGMAIRGGTLTTESVWDDTDVVHVLANLRPDLQVDLNGVAGPEIIQIPDFHTFGGLRLESGSTQSLVVKFDRGAGITATGRPLDIEDRIGGTLQVVGSPGFPVVLTSLTDDNVGAGFDPSGLAQTDTNGDGPSQASPGDWRGLVLDQFSNDRNVAIVNERESPNENALPNSVRNNSIPGNAEFLGQLAPNEKNGDDNLRLGFTVNGLLNRPGDIDVYSFRGTAGSEVWLDIDRTSSSLDTIVELISSNGDILALSDNSYDESVGGTTLLAHQSLMPPDRVHVLQRDAFGGYNTLDFSFRDDYTTNLRDAGMRVVLPGTAGAASTYFVRVRSNNQDPLSPQPRDIDDQIESPIDIPYEGGADLVRGGKTSGVYQLQIRLRATQEQAGSTVRFGDIRYATTGITTFGLPGHSPLLGEAAENLTGADNNDTFATAPDLGSLYSTDRGALSIAAQIAAPGDVDWFQFRLQQDSIDPLQSSSFTTPVILDIDYADGLGRPNTTIWLFNSQRQLVSFGTDSNIADDQPGPFGGVDQDDLTRGSAGPLDAWIGSMELPGGVYYVAVTNNSQVSQLIEQYQKAGVSAADALVRVEPISSVRRISSDHDFDGNGIPDNYNFNLPQNHSATAQQPITVAFNGNSNRIDYTLGDVVLFVTTQNGSNSLLRTVDPFTGRFETEISQSSRVLDIAMRPDGRLYGPGAPINTPFTDDRYDDILVLDTATNGPATVAGSTGIATHEIDAGSGNAARATTNSQGGNPPPRNGDGLLYEAITFVGASGNSTSLGGSANGLAMLAVAERIENPQLSNHEGNWLFRLNPETGAGVSAPFNDRTNNAVLNGAGTQVVDRGFIETLTDNLPNSTTAVMRATPGVQIVDGQTVRVGATVFEFDLGLTAALAPGAAGSMVDGDQIHILDSTGITSRLEIDFGQRLQVTNAGLVGDGQTFTLTTTSGTVLRFEFDSSVTPALSNPRNIRIPTNSSASALAANISNAVNGLGLPGVTAISQGTQVDFTGDSGLNVSGVPGLTTIGSYGVTVGRIPVPVRLGMTDAQLAQAIADTVNGPAVTDRLSAAAAGSSLRFGGGISPLASKPSWLIDTLSSRVGTNYFANVNDGQTMVIRDTPGGTNRTIEFDLGERLVVNNATQIQDGDLISITVGGNTRTFEFEDTGAAVPDGVATGNIPLFFDSAALPLNSQLAQQIASEAATVGIQSTIRGSTEIDFLGDTALSETSGALVTIGTFGTSAAVGVPIYLGMNPDQVAAAMAAVVNGSVFGGAIVMTRNGDTLQITGGDRIVSTPTWLSRPGVASNAYPVTYSTLDSDVVVAEALVRAMQQRGVQAENFEQVVSITSGTQFSVSGSTAPFGQNTGPAGGTITGLAPVEIGNNVRLFAVSNAGDLFEVTSSGGGAFNLGSSANRSDFIATIYDDNGQPVQFAGLTAGPRNVNGGALSQTLFGITTGGDIYAFDTAGRPAGVFMNGRRSVATGQSNATGLAFSNLDVNLWHVSNTRGADAGHGVQPSPDHNDFRTPAEPAGSNNSLYFGFENPRNSGPDIQTGQWGGIYDIANTNVFSYYLGNDRSYDFAGGAEGTMESNPLDLSAYAPEDLPTLYFSYYLETENANSDRSDSASAPEGNMQDAFRVYAAGEDGYWQLLATNNSESDRLTGLHGEYQDEFDERSSGGTKKVQELYDVGDGGAPDAWRQVRIPLEDFAGQKNVRIRFDFSTAASSAIGDPFTGGEELRAVAGSSIDSGDLLRLQSAENGTTTTFEFDMGLDLQIPSGANLEVGDFFWVDGQQYTFVSGIPGANQIPFATTDSAALLAQRVESRLQNDGYVVHIDPEQPNRLNVLNAQTGLAAAGLPPDFLLSQPGVGAGNVAINVHVGMNTSEVAAAVQQAFASALNELGPKSNTAPYQVRNGYMLSLYGHRVTNPGPLGLTRHAGELQPFPFSTPLVNGYPSRLPGQEFGLHSNPSRTSPGSLRGRNNNFEGVYVDDIIIGFRERGEMVLGAGADQTQFVPNVEYEPLLFSGQVDETERGAYQLEIRRGAGYAFDDTDGGVHDSNYFDTFDTNDRLTDSIALVAPVGALLHDAQRFTVSDGTDVVTFEFDDVSLPAGNPNVGVASGNVVVGFTPAMTEAQVARAMRDAINSSPAQTRLDVLAALSDGSTGGATTPGGKPRASNLVYLHGSATSDTFGSLDFGDLNNNGDSGSGRWFNNDDIIRFDRNFFPVAYLGDQNVFRDQGQVLLQGNVVTEALQFGISVLPGLRDRQDLVPLSGVLPHPGAPRQTLEINSQQLAPGVTVFNNVLNQNGLGGIEVRGETNAAGAAMAGAVPFARIVNNTVYGDGTGTGILVADNASPTLLNNIIANMNLGISVDASSDTTVIGSTLFQNNGTNSNFAGGNLGAFPITLSSGQPLFADPANGNFYLADQSQAIDSSLAAFADRSYFITIKQPLGIGQSPIIAPQRDITGQLRVDDPNVNTPSGIGQNVFVDRGAVDRSDFVGPTAALLRPQDNDLDGDDADEGATFVRLSQGTLDYFELVLVETNGTGPDVLTVDADAVTVTEDGRLLEEGVDYTFGFSATNRTIRLTPLSAIWRPDAAYEITLNNRDRIILEAPEATEIVDGDQFTITDTMGTTATFEYDTGYLIQIPQTLLIDVPAGQGPGSGFGDGERFSITAPDGTVVTFEIATVDRGTGANRRVLLNPGDTADEVREAIFDALLAESTVLDLAPRRVGDRQIQIGSKAGHAVNPLTSPITVSGIAAGIADGDSLSYTTATETLLIEFDNDGSASNASADVLLPFTRTDTPDELAARIADTFINSNLGLVGIRTLEQGRVALGGDPSDQLVISSATINQLGRPGVTGPLLLTFPAGLIAEDYEDKTVVLNVNGTITTFEFSLDSNRLPGTELILLQPGQDAAAVAARFAQAVDAAIAVLTPTVVNGNSISLGEPLGSSVDLSNSPITSTGVAGGATAVSLLPSSTFSRDIVAGQLLAAIVASPLQSGVFAPGGGDLYLDNTQSITGATSRNVIGIKDLAGNNLQPNRINAETQFTILMPGVDLDYGDAPLQYELNFNGSFNPARHTLSGQGQPRLGTAVDAETANPNPASDDLSPVVSASSAAPTFSVTGGGETAAITVGPDDASFAPAAGESVTVTVGTRSWVFELSTDGNVTVAGAIPVHFGPTDDAPAVAASLADAVRRVTGDPVVVSLETARQNEVRLTLVDDEDGVAIGPFQTVNSPAAVEGLFLDPSGGFLGFLNPSDPIGSALSVTVTGSGLLDAWVDFNQDGDWNDPGEQILANEAVLPGENRLLVKTPATAPNGLTEARFRLSTTGNQLPRGVAIGGEVEDYQVLVAAVVLPEPVDDAYASDEDTVLSVTDSSQGILFRADGPDVLNGLLNPGVEVLKGVTFGDLTLNSNGTFQYVPDEDFFGTDVFTYQIVGEQAVDPTDPNSPLLPIRSSKVGTVTITIHPVNDAPSALDKTFHTIETSDTSGNTAVTVTASELLAGALPQDDANSRIAPFNEKEQSLKVIQISVSDASGNDIDVVPVTGVTPADGQYTADTFVMGQRSGSVTVTVAGNAVTQVVYQAADDYNADNPRIMVMRSADGFRYTIADDGRTTLPSGELADPQPAPETFTANATIHVYPQNDLPVGEDDVIPGATWTGAEPTEDTALLIPRAFLLSNDVVGPAAAMDELFGVNDGTVLLADDPALPGLPAAFTPFPLTTAQGGTVSLDPAGDLIYAPAADYFGPDSFVYFVGDQGISEDINGNRTATPKYVPVTVSLTVAPVNDVPLAIDHAFQDVEDQTITITAAELLAGAVAHGDPQLLSAPWDETNQQLRVISLDVDGTTVTAANAGSGQRFFTPNGEVTATFDGDALVELQFIPNIDFNVDNPLQGDGSRTIEQIRYTIADDGIAILPQGGTVTLPEQTSTADIRITVTPQNDVPVTQPDLVQSGSAAWDAYFVDSGLPIPVPTEDTTLVIPAEFLLQNDAVARATAADERQGTNANDGVLSIVAGAITTSLGGTVSFDANGDLVYVPPADLYGLDTFVYTVTDQGINEAADGSRTSAPLTATATVTIDVKPVNDVPSAPDRQYALVESGELGENFVFTFTSDDLLFGALPETDDDAVPGVFADTLDAPYDESEQTLRVVQFGTSEGTVDVVDLPGGSGTFVLTTGTGGTLTLNFASGGFVDGTYVPPADYNERTPFDPTDAFTYLISDDGRTTSPDDGSVIFLPEQRAATAATVTLTVAETNDPPEFDSQATVEILERDDSQPTTIADFVINVLPGPATALDELERQNVTFTVPAALGSDPNGIMLQDPVVTAQGELVIYPAPDAVGTAIYVIRATDDDPTNPRFTDATVTINLRPVNDPPVFQDFPTIMVDEDLLDVPPGGGPLVIPVSHADLLTAFTVGPDNELDSTLGGNQKLQVDSFQATTDKGGTVTVMTDPTSGAITHLLYTPSADYNGTIGGVDTFTLTVIDDGQTWNLDDSAPPLGLFDDFLTATMTVTISLAPRNDAPTFTATGSYGVDNGPIEVLERDDAGEYSFVWATEAVVAPVTATDELPGGASAQSASFEIIADANNLDLLVAPPVIDFDQAAQTGTLRFTPRPDAVGTLIYAVTLVDTGVHDPLTNDFGRSVTRTLTINLRPVNDPPIPNPDFTFPTIVVDEDLLDQSPAGGPLMIPVDPGQFSELLSAFLPGPANEIDGTLGGNQTMQVVSTSVPMTTTKGGTLEAVTDANGVVTHLLYTPVPHYNDAIDGTDSFTITLRDDGRSWNVDPGQGPLGLYDDFLTVAAGIQISLTPRNDAPTFTAPSTVEVLERDNLSNYAIDWASDILVGPKNPGSIPEPSALDELTSQSSFFEVVSLDDPAVTSALLSSPLTIDASGRIEFTPRPDAVGSLRYAVTLVDSGVHDPAAFDFGRSATQTLTVTIRPVNDAPQVTGPVSVETSEDASITFAADPNDAANSPLLQVISVGPANETDGTDGGNQKATIVSHDAVTAKGGSVTPIFDASGSVIVALRYQPSSDYNDLIDGPDFFSYTVADDGITYQDAGDPNDGVVDGSQNDFRTVRNTVTISLTPVNDPPQFSGAGSVTVSEDAGQGVVGVPPGDVGLTVIPGWANAIFAGRSTAQDERNPVTGQQVQFVIAPVDPTAAAAVFSAMPTASPSGTLTFRTVQNAVGQVVFTVQLIDNGNANPPLAGDDNDSDVRTFTISVTPVNDPPTFVAGPDITVLEDSGSYASPDPWATAILAGPPDEVAEPQTVSFQVSATAPSLFIVPPSVDANGFLTFQLRPDANGQSLVTVTAVDSLGLAGQPHQMTLTVTATDDTPVAGHDSFDTHEDAQLRLMRDQLLANDQDVDLPDDTLSLTAVPAFSALGAAVSIDAAGNVLYNPSTSSTLQQMTPADSATDSFTYQVRDASGRLSNTATVTLNVAGRNDAPLLQADVVPINLNGPTTIRPLDNDTDVDGTIDPTTVEITVQPSFGAVAINDDGTLTYSPFATFQGQDTLSYVVADNLGQKSKQATITVSANLPPTFTAGPAVTVNEDSGSYAAAWATNIQPGPQSEADAGQTVQFQVSVPPQSQGLFSTQPTLTDDGFLAFTVADDAHGQAAVVITPVDSQGATGQPHTLTITINSVNDTPSAVGETFDTDEDTVLQLTLQQLLTNDSDADAGDNLTVTDLPETTSLGVTLSVDAAGNITYDPTVATDLQALSDGQSLIDTFTYRVRDTAGAFSDVVTVTLNVDGVNDAPTAGDDAALTYRDESIEIEVIDDDGDVEGPLDSQSVVITRDPLNGTVTVLADGRVRYVPNAGFAGQDSFGYTVSDSDGLASPEANVAVRIAGSRLQNPASGLAADVNASGTIEPLDALLIINYLNSGRPTTVTQTSSGPSWYDVDGNGQIQPLDALRVINAINRQARGLAPSGSGEGEAAVANGAAPSVSIVRAQADEALDVPRDAAPLNVAPARQSSAFDTGEAPQRAALDEVLDQLARQRQSDDAEAATATVDRVWGDFGLLE